MYFFKPTPFIKLNTWKIHRSLKTDMQVKKIHSLSFYFAFLMPPLPLFGGRGAFGRMLLQWGLFTGARFFTNKYHGYLYSFKKLFPIAIVAIIIIVIIITTIVILIFVAINVIIISDTIIICTIGHFLVLRLLIQDPYTMGLIL